MVLDLYLYLSPYWNPILVNSIDNKFIKKV